MTPKERLDVLKDRILSSSSFQKIETQHADIYQFDGFSMIVKYGPDVGILMYKGMEIAQIGKRDFMEVLKAKTNQLSTQFFTEAYPATGWGTTTMGDKS